MSRSTEMVLFYTPDTTARTTRLKGIFVRLGIRIRNITAEQMGRPSDTWREWRDLNRQGKQKSIRRRRRRSW